ncbi:MAG: ABC transporter permease [Bacteroidales bacterium]|nr:ABC transporter permease [Bacteroidales bacterium]MCB9000086.1 ABC transporter permease [Bacteroidales bacterium]MCB9012735.1 ABC transporter permease [Bacteroidales bacterium]
MFVTNLSLVIRKILRSPVLALINILCLSAGFVTVLFVSLWIRNELSYDTFHPNYKNIYRLTIKVDDNEAGYHSHFARSYYPWLYEIKDKIPGIDEIARLNFKKNQIIRTSTEETFRADIIFSDPGVFNVFHFNFLEGTAATALEKPFSVILSESTARKYFGDGTAVGQNVEIYCDRCEEKKQYSVSAVVSDFPPNSHFHFDMIGGIENPESFSDWAYYYVLLDKGVSPASVLSKFKDFAVGYVGEDYIDNLSPELQPLTDIHLKSAKDREIEINGESRNIWLFIGLSAFVLFVSLFNFINVRQVSLIRSQKDLSVMRIFGASRKALFSFQFIESFILSFLAILIAVLIVSLFLNSFNLLTAKDYKISEIWSSGLFYLLVMLLFLLSLLAGMYPFIISGIRRKIKAEPGKQDYFRPVVSKGKYRLTRIYIALQFAASIILISIVFVVNQQLDYFMQNRLGNNMGRILCIRNIPVQVLNNYQPFKAELLKNPVIQDVTCSFENPADENMDMMPFETPNVSDDIKNKMLFVYPADDNIFSFYNIRFLAGTGFPPYYGNDTIPETYILNKKACDLLGWKPEDAIDRPFTLVFDYDGKNLFKGGRISGVVKDFQMSSMKNEIKPYVFFQKSFWMESVQIKFDTSQTQQAFNFVKADFEKFFPGFPMQYSYVEDLYYKIYSNEFRLQSLSTLLGILAILLSMTGLWGITGIIYETKTKEIGIRKVNGAGKLNILSWLLKDINGIALVSVLIGIPLSVIIARHWLMSFPLRISLQWWMFVLPAAFIYMVAILTVILQANRVAGMNPVESMRYE